MLFFISEACDNRNLDDSFYISSLIQIILHIKPLSRLFILPFASVRRSREHCTHLISKVITTKFVVKALSCLYLKV
jgi:hypothetical protein